MTEVIQEQNLGNEQQQIAKSENQEKGLIELIELFKDKNIEVSEQVKSKLGGEDDFKKIKKKLKKSQNEIQKLKESQNYQNLVEKLNKHLLDMKTLNEEHLTTRQNYEANEEIKAKIQKENQNYQKQIDMAEKLQKEIQKKFYVEIDKHQETINVQKQKKQDLANQFQERIKDIQKQLEELNIAKLTKAKEFEILQEQQKEVDFQFNQRDQIFDAEIKKKDLENQLHETQFKEKLGFIENEAQSLDAYKEQLQKAEEGQAIFQKKLEKHQDYAQDFQDIMIQSNKAIGSYRQTLEKFYQTIKKLETDNKKLENTYQKNDLQIIDMAQENGKVKREVLKLNQQLESFKSLKEKLQKTLEEKQNLIKELSEQKQQEQEQQD